MNDDERAMQAATLHRAGANAKDIAEQYGWSLSTTYSRIQRGNILANRQVRVEPVSITFKPFEPPRKAEVAARDVDFEEMLRLARQTGKPLVDVLRAHGAI